MRREGEHEPEQGLPTAVLVFICGSAGAVLGLVSYASGWL